LARTQLALGRGWQVQPAQYGPEDRYVTEPDPGRGKPGHGHRFAGDGQNLGVGRFRIRPSDEFEAGLEELARLAAALLPSMQAQALGKVT
jgi:hypothetical protein